MAKGINKVILVGNLGQDPETRYLPSGGAVTNISIATSETWKDKESGQNQERTEWHRVVFFNRLAEVAGEYLKKGSKVYVEGQLRTRSWDDQQGQKRYTTEIVAREMQMLDGRGEGGAGGGGGSYGGNSGGNGGGNYQRGSGPQNGGQNNGQNGGQNNAPDFGAPPADDFDDDIPF